MTKRKASSVCATLVLAVACIGGCQAVQNADDQLALQYVDEAHQFNDRGLPDSALAAFGLALEENSQLFDPYLGIGRIFQDRGNYPVASRYYQRATELDPTNFQAHYLLGYMQQLMSQLSEAVKSYLRALAIDPSSFEANQNLASTYLQLSQPAEAQPYAQRATELRPDDQPAWANLAAAYNLLGRYEQAVDAYRQAMELGEIGEPILLGLAIAHIRLQNYDRAVNVLESLNRRAPSAAAYERLGYVQFKLRLFDESLANFRQSLALNDRSIPALNGLGVCLMTQYLQSSRINQAQRDEALGAWRRSLELLADQPRIADLLARYQRL